MIMLMLMLLNGKVRGMVGGRRGWERQADGRTTLKIRNKNAFITSSDAP